MNPEHPKNSIDPDPFAVRGGNPAHAGQADALPEASSEPAGAGDLENRIAERTPWSAGAVPRNSEEMQRAREVEALRASYADARRLDAEAREAEHRAEKMRHEATREQRRAEHEPEHLRLTLLERRVFMALLGAIVLLGAVLVIGGLIVDPLIAPAGVAVLSSAAGGAAYGSRMARKASEGKEGHPPSPSGPG